MRSVVVTGMAVLSAAGEGLEAFGEALRAGEPLGETCDLRSPRGKPIPIRVAPLGEWDAGAHLTPKERRKMAPEAQAVCSAFVSAGRAAGIADRHVAPERLGSYLGSGFGSMRTTEEYLRGLFEEGMATASPFLFAESLASSPLGHAAILLDARGPSLGFACGDASALAAVAEGWRDIRKGRVDRALCGGYELAGETLIGVLARLAVKNHGAPFVGDGVMALVLEAEEIARTSGAPLLARVTGAGSAGDPKARPTDWSHDPAAWAAAHDAALARRESPVVSLSCIYRHDPPSRGGGPAERRAIERLRNERGAQRVEGVHRIFGHHAAAGGLSVVAAALACAGGGEPVLVSAGSWGGSTSALLLEPA